MYVIPLFLIGLAGLVHLFIVPEHLSHAPAHGVAFAFSGIVQLLWVIAFWRRRNRLTYYAGFAVSGGLVTLWALTQLFRPPFAATAEPIDIATIVTKFSELIAFGLLILAGIREQEVSIQPRRKGSFLLEAVVLSVLVGVFSFTAGHISEPLFPQLQHAHADDDHHADDEHHDEDDEHHDSDEDDHHAEDESEHHDDEDHHDEDGDADNH